MTTVIVHHHVAEFDAWKAGFDGHEAARTQNGCIEADVYQSADDASAVTIRMRFADPAGAQGFLTDPSLKEAMAKAGVEGPPEIHVLDETDSITYEVVS